MAKKKAAHATEEPAAAGLGEGPEGREGAGAVDAAAAGRAVAGAPAGSLAESGGVAAEGGGVSGVPGLDAGAELPPAPGAAWPEGDEWGTDIDAAYLQSKYTLVSVAAKRARQLLAGGKRRVESMSEKPVTVALEELAQGRLIFERTRDGIK